jgi:hypothetical protein
MLPKKRPAWKTGPIRPKKPLPRSTDRRNVPHGTTGRVPVRSGRKPPTLSPAPYPLSCVPRGTLGSLSLGCNGAYKEQSYSALSAPVAHQLTSQVSQPSASAPSAADLTGWVLVLIQFDVCEEIRLDRLQQVINSRTVQQPNLKHAAPAYVRYQRPPVVVTADPLVLDSGEQLTGEIKYYDCGVVSILYQLPFSGDWGSLVRLASRWVQDKDFAPVPSQ